MSSIFDLAAHLRPTPRQLADAIARLGTEDVSALPLLDDGARRHLAQAAARLPFKASTPVVGEGERAVRQAFQYCVTLPQNSLLRAFASCLERRLNDSLTLLDPPPLAGAIRLNDFIVQRYQLGSVGITPHRDHVKYGDYPGYLTPAPYSDTVGGCGGRSTRIPSSPWSVRPEPYMGCRHGMIEDWGVWQEWQPGAPWWSGFISGFGAAMVIFWAIHVCGPTSGIIYNWMVAFKNDPFKHLLVRRAYRAPSNGIHIAKLIKQTSQRRSSEGHFRYFRWQSGKRASC